MSGEIMETRMRATLAVAVLVVVYPAVAFAQLAPQSQAEFEQRFTGWALQSDAPDCNEGDGIDPITFIEPGRFDVTRISDLAPLTARVYTLTRRSATISPPERGGG